MRKEFFGAALFFCGLGILLSLFCPFEAWALRLIISLVLMLAGYHMGC